MNVNGKAYRTIWLEDGKVRIIDQRNLPHDFVIEELKTVEDVAEAIREMHIRGAGAIGAAAGYGMYIAATQAPGEGMDYYLKEAGERLRATRPTAVNLQWAIERQLSEISKGGSPEEKRDIARRTAQRIADEDADYCRRIGEHGLRIIEELSRSKGGKPVNILTHCNAGWLAFVDYGTATAPIYAAHERGIPVHVWVDETRPRNQGARLTAWELGQHGVPHTVISDNTGGHLMQNGMVDMVIVGSDRTTYTGNVANKIGTYLKALAARDNNIPFYVALPSSTLDWKTREGEEIPIEERDSDEIRFAQGMCEGSVKRVLLTPEKSPAANYAFDVTHSRLVTGLITERGICRPDEGEIRRMFPEK